MEKFSAIAGLPRSGSTLLQNVLNQNPAFFASSTSPVGSIIGNLTAQWSQSAEVKSELINHGRALELQLTTAAQAFIESWYAGPGEDKTVVFDKCRGWNHEAEARAFLYPEGVTIVMVRNLLDVLASVEKREREFPLLRNQHQNPYTRADQMFSPDGMIGGCILGVEAMIRSRPDQTIFVKFENFVDDPASTMQRIYRMLGEDYFEDHDYDNVENTATDVDGLYLNKFPHKGEGPIRPRPSEVDRWVSEDIQELINDKFRFYNKHFGYGDAE